MSAIELVIKLDESIYNRLCFGVTYAEDIQKLCEELNNGIQLPKGHKRLIEDNFEIGPVFDQNGNRVGYKYVTQEDLNNALTIIEADKEN